MPETPFPIQQYVIQEHTTAADTHWDLMLEMGPALWTWRLPVRPEQIGNEAVQAQRISDHPLRFLNYEGPVQHGTGYDRISDKGHFRICTQTPDRLTVELSGRVLQGRFTLCSTDKPSLWSLQTETEQR